MGGAAFMIYALSLRWVPLLAIQTRRFSPNSFVDCRRGHPISFALLVKLFRAIKNRRRSDLAVRELS